MGNRTLEGLTNVAIVIAALVLVALFAAVPAWVFQFAWNVFMPVVWKAAPHLNFWQAFAATIIIGMFQAPRFVRKEKKS